MANNANNLLLRIIIGDENSKFDGNVFDVYKEENCYFHKDAFVKSYEFYKKLNYEILEGVSFKHNTITSLSITEKGHIVFMNLSCGGNLMALLFMPAQVTNKQYIELLKLESELKQYDLMIISNAQNKYVEEEVNELNVAEYCKNKRKTR